MRLVQFVLASDAPAGNKGVVRVGVELPVAAGNGSDVDAGAGAGAGAGANGGGVESRSAGKVLDLTAAFRMEGAADGVPDLLSAGMKGLLAGGAAAMAAVRKAMVAARRSSACVLDRSDIVLKAPIYDSEKVLCVGMNYVDHCTGTVCSRGLACSRCGEFTCLCVALNHRARLSDPESAHHLQQVCVLHCG